MIDGTLWVVIGTAMSVLTLATWFGRRVARVASSPREQAAAADLQARIAAWWWIIPVMVGCLSLRWPGILGFFAVVSFLALRELLTLTRSRRADHTTLLLAFFVAVPVQYGLIWVDWVGLFLVFIPVWALVVVSVRLALKGDTTRFLERVASIQYALMVGIYCLSHAPALVMLHIPGFEGMNHKLVAFLVIVAQASDVLQFIWGRLLGRTPLMPSLSPNKTVEGMLGGVVSAALLGGLLTPLMPYGFAANAGLGALIAVTGVLGGLVMSAIKRDAGVKDYGSLIRGHGGVLDRADSLVFAAPVFFHVLWWVHGA